MANPFKPTAGATPPLLVGRQPIIEEFQESIEDGPGAPGLLQLLAGARGVGKTVMLTELGDVALSNGWVVIHETAGPRVLSKIGDQAKSAREELGSLSRGGWSSNLTLKIPSVLEYSHHKKIPDGTDQAWDEELSTLLDTLAPHGTGVCITVDEVHSLADPVLHELATQMQMFVRNDRPIALIMAGLPAAINELLAGEDKPTTFLRRAEQPEMRDVSVNAVADAFRETFSAGNRTISDELIQQCAQATGGYPFMIQLVGYHVWRQGKSGPITEDHVDAGIKAAQARIGNLVHAPALKDLSDVDRSFLVHMAADDGPSKVSEIGSRMGRSGNYATVYRSRLISAGMIHPAGHGLVDFDMPYMREYLRDHATHLLTD